MSDVRDPEYGVELAKRIEAWQKRVPELGVSHFRFTLTLDDNVPGSPHASAAAVTPSDYDNVEFHFAYGFLEDATDERIDEVIVHEWVHVAMRDLDHTLHAVEKWMPEATYADFEETVDHEREGLVDRLAKLIYRLNEGKPPLFSPH